jgi:glycosyltransferase involved in cell wall biosynthesis
MILFIFTNSYPYQSAAEQTFLSGEVKILRKYFERVIICPQSGEGDLLSLPDGVEADLSFKESFTTGCRIPAGFSALFLRDLYADIWNRLPGSFSPAYLKKLFSFLSGARLTQVWFENRLRREAILASDVTCYTYWFTEAATGLAWAKRGQPDLRLVSRAHGYDLYEELYKPWPLRSFTISMLDGLYADSDIGTAYLTEKYPQFKERYKTALLGVPEAGGLSQPSTDGVLRIASCSMINPVKRIDLLFAGIVSAARMRKDQRIEWTHFGGGVERNEFVERIAKEFPPNAKGSFPGYQTQRHLIQNYINNPVDVFVNVSSTEGTPVSIMEAVSCGIPIIATAVGGNVEIVQERNGILLSANPTPDEIAQALLWVCDEREAMLEKRKVSRVVWQERYNETTNFEAFAQALVEIRKR